jgi:hypothetical protein
MESLPSQTVNELPHTANSVIRSRRHMGLAVPLLLAVVTTGCMSTGSFLHSGEVKPTGNICQVVATWSPEVVYTPDPAHGGEPTPGIAGRMYLFGPEIGYPLVSDGSLVVDLYYDPPGVGGKATVPLEEWCIDKDTLKRLQRRDAIGWGYTLFLPWGTYKPEITNVRLRVRYEPTKGTPLYAETYALTLNKDLVITSQTSTRVLPEQQNPATGVGQAPSLSAATQPASAVGQVANVPPAIRQVGTAPQSLR